MNELPKLVLSPCHNNKKDSPQFGMSLLFENSDDLINHFYKFLIYLSLLFYAYLPR